MLCKKKRVFLNKFRSKTAFFRFFLKTNKNRKTNKEKKSNKQAKLNKLTNKQLHPKTTTTKSPQARKKPVAQQQQQMHAEINL